MTLISGVVMTNCIQCLSSKGLKLASFFLLALSLVSITPQQLHALPAAGRFAYVVDGAGNQVDEFSIKVNGALVALPGACANIATAAGPNSAVVDPTGRFLYVANQIANAISVFPINVITGCLGAPAVFGVGAGPTTLGITPDGAYLYVDNQVPSVEGYSLNPINGALVAAVPGSPFALPIGTAEGLAVDPAGYVYEASIFGGAGTISGYSIVPGGTLVPVPGSPFGAVNNPYLITVDPVGQFLEVAYKNINKLGSYTIAPGTGTLALANLGATAGAPWGVAVDPFGQFAYTSNNAGSVSSFNVNALTGLLAVNGPAKAAGGFPIGATADQTGKFLYVADSGTNQVSGYAINAANGILAPIAGQPWATGNGPVAIATTP